MKRTMILLALAWLLIGMSASAEGKMTQTGYTDAVPAAYTVPAERQGTVEALVYSTRDYARNAETVLEKTAYVYMPYGYDDSIPCLTALASA